MKNLKIGILGGGQLGRMLQEKALEYGVNLKFLDPDIDCSCSVFSNSHTIGNYKDYDDIVKFGEKLDVISIEIEHVNAYALLELEKKGVKIIPSASSILLLQNKATQKEFYRTNNIPTSDFIVGENNYISEIEKKFLPAYQKTQKDGYDGKGVQWLTNDTINKELVAPFILEKPVEIEKELAITYIRTFDGITYLYPICEMVFSEELNLVDYLMAPAMIDSIVEKKINEITLEISNTLKTEGVFSIEFFLSKSGDVLVNEMAPRAHNSAHYTIEACNISQFEAQLRVLLQLPIPKIELRKLSSMINLVGAPDFVGVPSIIGLECMDNINDCHLHLYGKKTTKPGRKMGHITILNHDIENLQKETQIVKNNVKIISK